MTDPSDELPRHEGVSPKGVPFAFELTRGSQRFEPDDDNVDARLMVNGRTYFPTVFTPANLTTLMETHERTGEACGGSYLMASDMVVVRRLSIDALRSAFGCLIDQGDLERIQSQPTETE